ncbi:adenylosuccinate lyase family protein [Nocardioides sp. KR10-350]|uniref:class-II fumarase/aspartase family protein n=1 Tax=Nocardioides cheoyonin TaxID=3156615 RepID=UPI0032B3FE47
MPTGSSRRFTDARVPDPGIAELFSTKSRLQARLRVEAALARAEAALDVIPAEAGEVIAEAADLDRLDLDRIEDGTAAHSHPLTPLLDELSRVVGAEHGGWVHWGATTQNITQTADLLLLREAHGRILDLLGDLLRALSKLADDSAEVPMPGRTHSQHAVPITFGFKVAMWIDELASHVDRLQRLEDRLFRLLLGGAVGTMASFGDRGRDIEAQVARLLDLAPMPVPSRATNDGMVEYVTVLGLLAGTAGKIAKDVYAMMQPEFGEAFEPIPDGTIGSSTMPHKRNPQLTLDVMTASAQLRGLVAPALESMLHDHEANGGMTGLLEETVAQASVLAGDVLTRLVVIAGGLELDTDRMRANLALSGGLIGSESLMLQLGERIGRDRAHEIVYDLAQEAAVTGRDFAGLLGRDETVAGHFSPAEIDRLLDPAHHLGESAATARAMAEHARRVADRLQIGEV